MRERTREPHDPLTPRATPNPDEAAAGGPAFLSKDEVTAFLHRHDWGILATAVDDQPYAVPVGYGFDGERIYIATGPGQKLENIERNRRICLTVAEVENGSRWTSVVILGRAVPADGMRETLRAIALLARRASPSPRDIARFSRARIFRIEPEEISGRSRG